MKKFILPLLLAGQLLVLSLSGCLSLCASVNDPTTPEYYWYRGYYSYPVIYIGDSGVNSAYFYRPVTGNLISDATVIVSNETTGEFRNALWTGTSYTPTQELTHTAGQRVTLSITTTRETVTGSSTVTPNPTYSNLSPTSGATARLPFTVSWEVTQSTYEATHTWVQIFGATTAETNNYQVVVPASQKSVQITSQNISAGTGYLIQVFGINSMNLRGGKSGSAVYVGGGNIPYTMMITIEAQ